MAIPDFVSTGSVRNGLEYGWIWGNATHRQAAKAGTHMSDYIGHDGSADGLDRRGFLRCMAWAGTGLLWNVSSGVPASMRLGPGERITPAQDGLFFAQISDSHIGFKKAANTDVTATLRTAVERLNALPRRPAFVLHTGDITQLSKPDEFDTADQVLRDVKTDRLFYVPGEHDVATDNGALYLKRFAGQGARGQGTGGWYSFDHSGVHFVALVNVLGLRAGGFGALGAEQLDWLRKDVASLAGSTPIVVFAHVPLWSVYPAWGWATEDSEQALALLRRFGSVTVLNGHIHQIMQKVEGHVTFHTALSTAFPQPAPGTAPSPGPMTVGADRLGSFLGVRRVTFVPGRGMLAAVDQTLSGGPVGDFAMGQGRARGSESRRPLHLAANEVAIANFAFTPQQRTVRAGTTVTWINRDDTAHAIASATGAFRGSKALDTDQRYSVEFTKPGSYDYFCSIHPMMKGRLVVQRG
jgi:3',5'-cyclic-AMP phosphodiesterase